MNTGGIWYEAKRDKTIYRKHDLPTPLTRNQGRVTSWKKGQERRGGEADKGTLLPSRLPVRSPHPDTSRDIEGRATGRRAPQTIGYSLHQSWPPATLPPPPKSLHLFLLSYTSLASSFPPSSREFPWNLETSAQTPQIIIKLWGKNRDVYMTN